MTPEAYIREFGWVTPETPFGHKIWSGMRRMLQEWVEVGGQPAYYPPNELSLGWFTAPEPFSRANARLPVEPGRAQGFTYPAVFFYEQATNEYIMWCEHILLMRSRSWRARASRAAVNSDAEVLLQLLPP